MSLTPWKILASNYLHKHIRQDTCELANGRVFKPIILEYTDWVTVVALTRAQEVVMIRQYRHGAQQVILELPGGAMDPGEESPLLAARRELLEETGYSGETFIQIGKVSPNPANQTNLIHSFLALDVEKVSSQELDGTEEIEVLLLPLEEVISMAKRGDLLQSMQVSAIFFLLAYLDRIE
jgi:ADP-ribose pyrophosphatase